MIRTVSRYIQRTRNKQSILCCVCLGADVAPKMSDRKYIPNCWSNQKWTGSGFRNVGWTEIINCK